jgi:hypothetical protein
MDISIANDTRMPGSAKYISSDQSHRLVSVSGVDEMNKHYDE